jgi:hypothetical protein
MPQCPNRTKKEARIHIYQSNQDLCVADFKLRLLIRVFAKRTRRTSNCESSYLFAIANNPSRSRRHHHPTKALMTVSKMIQHYHPSQPAPRRAPAPTRRWLPAATRGSCRCRASTSYLADTSTNLANYLDDESGAFLLQQPDRQRKCSMHLPSLKVLAAASAVAASALLLVQLLRRHARRSNDDASLVNIDLTRLQQSDIPQNPPIFSCDTVAAEERMRRGARARGEPCVLDVCATNAAEYRRGGCDMIVRDFIEAGASEWAVDALRCILVARGADQAFRF